MSSGEEFGRNAARFLRQPVTPARVTDAIPGGFSAGEFVYYQGHRVQVKWEGIKDPSKVEVKSPDGGYAIVSPSELSRDPGTQKKEVHKTPQL